MARTRRRSRGGTRGDAPPRLSATRPSSAPQSPAWSTAGSMSLCRLARSTRTWAAKRAIEMEVPARPRLDEADQDTREAPAGGRTGSERQSPAPARANRLTGRRGHGCHVAPPGARPKARDAGELVGRRAIIERPPDRVLAARLEPRARARRPGGPNV